MTTLHLITQRDQPYGSRRKCCERCGAMASRDPSFGAFTDEENVYAAPPDDYVPCDTIAAMAAKKKASGVNIPEAQRGTVAVKLRLPPDVAEDLDELANRWRLTRSGTVARLLEERADRSPHATPIVHGAKEK